MTQDERALLLEIAKFTNELANNRNDMLVGVVAAILDLYRTDFREGKDTKQDAINRLRLQQEVLAEKENGLGNLFLKWLSDTLETDRLDAAKLYRDPPAGSA
jgi:hypothetical protein